MCQISRLNMTSIFFLVKKKEPAKDFLCNLMFYSAKSNFKVLTFVQYKSVFFMNISSNYSTLGKN